MRWLTFLLVLLIAALQYPLWFSKGSWLKVWGIDQKITVRKKLNRALMARNTSLAAEVRDLKHGYAAIEERARSELGMIKQGEIFYQVLVVPPAAKPTSPPKPLSHTKSD